MTRAGLSHEERGLLRQARHGNFVHLETAVEAIVAAHTTDLQEALDSCREQRADLLELLDAEREQHAARTADLAAQVAQAWDEGYQLGINDKITSQDWTDGQVPPNRANPYRATLSPAQPDTEGGDNARTTS